jgi:hypothetical protein
MTGDDCRQARLLARLREVRLISANRSLMEARRAAAKAETQLRFAETEAEQADVRLTGHRLQIAARPTAAPLQLALIDHSLFLHAVARSACNDAAETLDQCRQTEKAQRRAMIRARARRDRMAGHARLLERRRARRQEELGQIEIEEAGRCA